MENTKNENMRVSEEEEELCEDFGVDWPDISGWDLADYIDWLNQLEGLNQLDEANQADKA